MCLGEVGQVREVLPGRAALVGLGARAVPVSLLTLEGDVGPGDWVVVHSGFALARLDPAEAAEAVALRRGAGVAPDDARGARSPRLHDCVAGTRVAAIDDVEVLP